ncbi:hypothetical protein [Shewanella inventionis]|nr:hypothetical protein [Shewanella inventionis]
MLKADSFIQYENLYYLRLKVDVLVAYTTIWRNLSKLKKNGVFNVIKFSRSKLKCSIWYPVSFDDKPKQADITERENSTINLTWANSIQEKDKSIFITRTIINLFQVLFKQNNKNNSVKKVTTSLPSLNPIFDGPVNVKLTTTGDSDLPSPDDIIIYGSLIKCVVQSRLEHKRRGANNTPSSRMSFQVPINSIVNEVNISDTNAPRSRANIIASLLRLSYATITINPETLSPLNIELDEEIMIIDPISNFSTTLRRTVDGENFRGSGLMVADFNLPNIVCDAIDRMVFEADKGDFERITIEEQEPERLHEISSLFANTQNKTLSLLVVHLLAKSRSSNIVEESWPQIASAIENGLTASKLKLQITKIFNKSSAIKTHNNGLLLEDKGQRLTIYPSKVVYELKN